MCYSASHHSNFEHNNSSNIIILGIPNGKISEIFKFDEVKLIKPNLCVQETNICIIEDFLLSKNKNELSSSKAKRVV